MPGTFLSGTQKEYTYLVEPNLPVEGKLLDNRSVVMYGCRCLFTRGELKMVPTLDTPTANLRTISLTDALEIARHYVATLIDPTFVVISDRNSHPQANMRGVWRFWVRCAAGPLNVIDVDAPTGAVQPFTEHEIRVIREKAAVLAANKAGVLPLDQRGYVLGEYARRRANRYLGDHIAMYFGAADPVFVTGAPPCWQVTIVFKMYDIGPLTVGTLAVDAKSGEPQALTTQQIQQIKERAHAFVELQTQTTTASH